MIEKRSGTSIAALWLHRAESVILVLIAIVLIIIAVFLLANSVLSLSTLITPPSPGGTTVRDLAIEILDSVLLVMMTMEIVYTVAVSLESHQLVAEPFLIIGAIAAIRRMLVITAESTKIESQTPSENQFFNLLVELGLLAVIVIAMAVSIYILRRSSRYVPPAPPKEE